VPGARRCRAGRRLPGGQGRRPGGRPGKAWGSRQAFLGFLDAAGVVRPQRTAGGRRHYTRRQLALAARVRDLLDQGHTLAAARRILSLEDDLATERALAARLHAWLARQHPDGS
jgi:MerR family transcriptional regulator, heat shock protein HspR